MEQKWDSLHFGWLKDESVKGAHIFEVQVCLNDLDPDLVQVELFADGINGELPSIQMMIRIAIAGGPENFCVYRASVTIVRPASDYTVRIIPCLPGVLVPLETSRILWQQ